jgi:DNA polymerase-3 subunit delta
MPLLRPEALHGQLERNLSPLYVLHGDEPLLVAEAGDAIRAAARTHGYTEREVLVAGPAFKWDTLSLAAGNLSLFGGNKLVDLRIPTGKPGKDGGPALVRYCAGLHDGVITLITLPQLDWQMRKSAWFTALASAGAVVELNAPGLPQLPDWIGTRLARQKQSASRPALELIAAHVEGNLLAAHQEIQKLGLLYPPGELGLEQVEDAVLNVARYDVDKLRAAFLAADAARCARLLDGLKAGGVPAPLVLWALATEIRSLSMLRAGMDRGEPLAALLKAARIFDPRRASAVQSLLAKASTAQLRSALQHAARIDRMAKGLIRGDIWDEFLQLSLRIAARKAT